jgi:cytochrome c5
MTDRNFVKTFSGLAAALAALTVVIFILAQMVVSASNLKKDKNVAQNDAAVAERIKPVGEVAVSNGSKVMDTLIPAANAAGADKGKATYEGTCAVCHGAGIAGAPKFGDKAAWAPRITQGADTLHTHALKGFQGKVGMMPAKGGNAALPDADVKAAVDYMVEKAK